MFCWKTLEEIAKKLFMTLGPGLLFWNTRWVFMISIKNGPYTLMYGMYSALNIVDRINRIRN